jgi:hypothetical protein
MNGDPHIYCIFRCSYDFNLFRITRRHMKPLPVRCKYIHATLTFIQQSLYEHHSRPLYPYSILVHRHGRKGSEHNHPPP